MFLDKTGLEHLWTHIVSRLGNKVDKVDGKGLSTNDYTTAEKNKLAGIDTQISNSIVAESAYFDADAESTGGTSAPLDADTLGGVRPSGYVTQHELSVSKAEISEKYLLKTETAANSIKFDNKAPEYYLQPRNLLDNSDFTNPVNQRGASGAYEAWSGDTIDRWKVGELGLNMTIYTGGSIGIKGDIFQIIPNPGFYAGKALTFAAKIYGHIFCCSGIVIFDNKWHRIARDEGNETYIDILTQEDNTLWCQIRNEGENDTYLEWAALYEGTYTAETLPPYVPKGKRVEMLNCGVTMQPRNLLDNSYWERISEIVNQRGETRKQDDWVYWIDRWIVNTMSAAAELRDGGIYLPATIDANLRLVHRIPIDRIVTGRAYTLAVCESDGTIRCVHGVYNGNIAGDGIGDGSVYVTLQAGDETYVYFIIDCYKNTTLRWAALYEGTYTADTLPPYVPKGYAAELAECQRYYRRYDILIGNVFYPQSISTGVNVSGMRKIPNISCGSASIPGYTPMPISSSHCDTNTSEIWLSVDSGLPTMGIGVYIYDLIMYADL